MIATPDADADRHPEPTTLPPTGSRVWVTAVTKNEYDQAQRLLAAHGLEAVAFATGADAVLLPEQPPAELVAALEGESRQILRLDELRAGHQRGCQVAVEVSDDTVRILDLTLPRQPAEPQAAAHRVAKSLVPAGDRFGQLCLDGPFLRAARSVSLAAATAMPCGLEGVTAAAKTTAVLWVAHLCRQPTVRLNLSGQSDTGELVGRFVPCSDWADWDLELMRREGPLLAPRSRELIHRALEEGRQLNWMERAAIAAAEQLPAVGWRFWEGVIPAAMRKGHWVILDELNLAEPQVLERLNPVLEQPASLVMTEHQGECYGRGGDVPLADSFRIFATLNPAEYAGRSVLSPAFRDRWTLWNIVYPPGEKELRSLLDRLVYGVHPEVVIDGTCWRGADEQPVYPRLASQPGIDHLLGAIAGFHAAITAAAGDDGATELGGGRRERYVFTRRTLLATMSLFAGQVSAGRAIGRAARAAVDQMYLQRVQPGSDRAAVRAALRTVELA
jgi:MoxR-like ATPase